MIVSNVCKWWLNNKCFISPRLRISKCHQLPSQLHSKLWRLSGDSRGVIYDRNKFLIQATGINYDRKKFYKWGLYTCSRLTILDEKKGRKKGHLIFPSDEFQHFFVEQIFFEQIFCSKKLFLGPTSPHFALSLHSEFYFASRPWP
jgi:hypothetical protein